MPASAVTLRRLAVAATVACAVVLTPVAALAAPGAAGRPVARPAAPAAVTPACATSGLVIWLTSDGAAAGTAFFTLHFTNLSGHACLLHGHPGVAAVSLTGRQIGAPAGAEPPAGTTVRLANHATGFALISYSDVITGGSGPKPCDAVIAAGFRVVPPGQKASKVVPLPIAACTRTNVVYARVGPVQKTDPQG